MTRRTLFARTLGVFAATALLASVSSAHGPGQSLLVSDYTIALPDACSLIALAIDAPTPDAVIAIMRDFQKHGPMHLSVVRTTSRLPRTKDGQLCETLLLDVRLKGERVFSVAADVQDRRPWWRKLWPFMGNEH